MSDYQECDKLKSVENESQVIGEFLEWCTEQGLELRDWNNTYHDQPQAINKTTEQLLAKYFDIDLAKVETERRAMLESLAQTQG